MSKTRAKFVCSSVPESNDGSREVDGKWERCLVKSVRFAPVYANGDPNHENSKFWQATPSGQLELSFINLDAAAMFVPGREYYLDITPANSSGD